MSDAKSILVESMQGVPKGHNGLLDPLLLPEGYAARLHNVVVRNGFAESRPRLVGVESPAQGRFQGAFAYVLEDATRWVLVVSGQVWVYNFSTNGWLKVAEFPTTDFDQAYFCQAGRYCIVQNGISDPVENWPIIIHGELLVDNIETEYIYNNAVVKVKDFSYTAPSGLVNDYDAIRVPIGKAMAFGQGRLFVAVDRYYDNGLSSGRPPGWRSDNGLRNILASNLENGDEPAAMLVFRQSDVLSGGGAFTLPAESGYITSMTFFRNAATGTGLGELLVMCRRGSAAFAVSVARDQWFTNGFGQQLFQTSGSASPWSMTAVNSDLVYYGDGGLRTIKYTASGETASGGLATVPVSPEVSNYTDATLGYEAYVTAALADNYLFFTAGGVRLADGSTAFSDVLPWDLSMFQASGEAPSRVFAGAWRGQLVHAVLRVSPLTAGAFYRDSATGALKLGVYVDSPDASQTSVVRTRAYAFKAAIMAKRVKFVDLMFDRVRTDLSVKVRWRSDFAGGWHASDTRHFQSTGNNTTGLIRIPCEADNLHPGQLIEFAVEWTGHARLKLCLFHAAVLSTFDGDDDSACAPVDLDDPVGEPGTAAAPEE